MNLQRSPIRGAHAWALVAFVIAAIDIFAKPEETLTEAAHRAFKRNPAAVILIVAATSLHLIFGWNDRYRRVDAYRALELVRAYTSTKSA